MRIPIGNEQLLQLLPSCVKPLRRPRAARPQAPGPGPPPEPLHGAAWLCKCLAKCSELWFAANACLQGGVCMKGSLLRLRLSRDRLVSIARHHQAATARPACTSALLDHAACSARTPGRHGLLQAPDRARWKRPAPRRGRQAGTASRRRCRRPRRRNATQLSRHPWRSATMSSCRGRQMLMTSRRSLSAGAQARLGG